MADSRLILKVVARFLAKLVAVVILYGISAYIAFLLWIGGVFVSSARSYDPPTPGTGEHVNVIGTSARYIGSVIPTTAVSVVVLTTSVLVINRAVLSSGVLTAFFSYLVLYFLSFVLFGLAAVLGIAGIFDLTNLMFAGCTLYANAAIYPLAWLLIYLAVTFAFRSPLPGLPALIASVPLAVWILKFIRDESILCEFNVPLALLANTCVLGFLLIASWMPAAIKTIRKHVFVST